MEPVALVVGESLVDVVRRPGGDQSHAGGSGANTAVALARLGRETWMATAWARDAHGELLRRHLDDNGIHLLGDPYVLARTSTAVATIGADGSAAYEFDLETRLPGGVLPADRSPVVVTCGSIMAVTEPGAAGVRRVVREQRERALVHYDVNARTEVTGARPEMVARVEELAGDCHLVKASEEDLAALWPGLGEDDVVARLLDLGAVAVVLTRGDRGASWRSATLAVDVASPAVDVVDTIGAGDTLGAAMLDELWRRGVVGPGSGQRLAALDPEAVRAVLEFATRAASVTVSRPGADPPRAHELDAGDAGTAR